MRRRARLTQGGVSGFSAGWVWRVRARHPAQAAASPVPAETRRGCAEALKAEGTCQGPEEPKREARDQGVARGARRNSPSGGPALPPYPPSRDPPDARGTDRAPRSPLALERRAAARPRAAQAARTTAHARLPPMETHHDRRISAQHRVGALYQAGISAREAAASEA